MNMLRVPQLDSLELVIRRIALSDADEWAEYAALPEVTRYTSSTVKSVDDVVPIIDRSLAGDPSAPVLFAVRLRTTGQFVATVGFHTIQPHNRTAEITYDVRPSHWGQGIASTCCLGAVKWGFTAREWVRIQSTTQDPNLASRAVLQKCGFTFEGKLRNFRMVRGKPCDYLLFAIVPGDLGTNLS